MLNPIQTAEPVIPVQGERREAPVLRHFLGIVRDSKWAVLGIAGGVLTLGMLYSLLATPIYHVDSLIQVEQPTRLLPGLDELKDALGAVQTPSQAEIEIIRSRSVIGRVVEDLGLDIVAAPQRFPFIGSFIGRQAVQGETGNAWPGLRRFAWAGEYIVVDRLSVPPSHEDTPLVLKAGSGGRYSLSDDEGRVLLSGEAGKPASSVANSDRAAMFVREFVAQPGTEFILVKRPFDRVVAELQDRLKVSERGKQSGILVVSLDGDDPKQLAAVVNGVVGSYLRQNVERRSQEASLMLSFLDRQLPDLKQQLETAEVELREYKSRQGAAVDISVEGHELLGRATDLEKQISELELQKSELQLRYTDKHPILIATAQKLAQLDQARTELAKQFEKLPHTELESVRLLRNVTVANELYLQLLNRSQELKVAKAGTVGNARILDAAIVARDPVHPNRMVTMFLSLLLGPALGILAVFVRHAMRTTLRQQEEVEACSGLPVYAAIPDSRREAQLARTKHPRLLCRVDPSDGAVEGMRSLCTSLRFALDDVERPVIAIHSATPEVGKSFIATNIGALLSDLMEGSVLVVDADLRKGHIHRRFDVARSPGLAEALVGENRNLEFVRTIEPGRLHVLPSGTPPPNPAEILSRPRFGRLIEMARQRFDYVILDCAPMLNLADAVVLAKLATANFMVARADLTTTYDLRMAIKRFEGNRISLKGVIFNGFNPHTSQYYYGSHYYNYRYQAEPSR